MVCPVGRSEQLPDTRWVATAFISVRRSGTVRSFRYPTLSKLQPQPPIHSAISFRVAPVVAWKSENLPQLQSGTFADLLFAARRTRWGIPDVSKNAVHGIAQTL